MIRSSPASWSCVITALVRCSRTRLFWTADDGKASATKSWSLMYGYRSGSVTWTQCRAFPLPMGILVTPGLCH